MALTLSPSTDTRSEQSRGSRESQAEGAVWTTATFTALVGAGLDEGLSSLAVSPLMSKLAEVFKVSPFEQDQAFAQLANRSAVDVDVSRHYSLLAKENLMPVNEYIRREVASSLSDFLVNAA